MSCQSGISASLQHKGQKIFMVAIPALHPGKAVVQVATVQVAGNDLPEVRPPEPVRPFEVEANAIEQTKLDLMFGNHSKILMDKDEPHEQFEFIFPLTIHRWFNMLQNKKSGGKGKP